MQRSAFGIILDRGTTLEPGIVPDPQPHQEIW